MNNIALDIAFPRFTRLIGDVAKKLEANKKPLEFKSGVANDEAVKALSASLEKHGITDEKGLAVVASLGNLLRSATHRILAKQSLSRWVDIYKSSKFGLEIGAGLCSNDRDLDVLNFNEFANGSDLYSLAHCYEDGAPLGGYEFYFDKETLEKDGKILVKAIPASKDDDFKAVFSDRDSPKRSCHYLLAVNSLFEANEIEGLAEFIAYLQRELPHDCNVNYYKND